MRSNRRIRGNLCGQSCLVLIFLAAWLSATMPAAVLCGQDAASEPALGEEPKALLSPVNLLPVDPVAEAGGKKPSATGGGAARETRSRDDGLGQSRRTLRRRTGGRH